VLITILYHFLKINLTRIKTNYFKFVPILLILIAGKQKLTITQILGLKIIYKFEINNVKIYFEFLVVLLKNKIILPFYYFSNYKF